MYNSQILSENIKLCAKSNGISVKTLLSECALGKNTVGKIANGTDIGIQAIVKIADYLDISVDYLLGRKYKNSAPDDVRSAIISRVYAMPEEQCKKLLDFLESLVVE